MWNNTVQTDTETEAISTRLYRKADTILDVRPADDTRVRVTARLRTLQNGMACDPAGTEDERSRVVRQALDDALADPAAIPAGPHFQLRQHVVEEIDRLDDALLPRYLFYRYRYDVYPALRRLDDYPPCVQIEPTAVCNFRCVFCYQTDRSFTGRSNGHMGSMDLGLFREVVEALTGHVEAVTFASRGEPLLSRDITSMLACLEGRFLAAKLNTNASLLTEENAHAVLSAGLQTLVFSADAAAEPLYSQLRVNGSLDKVLRNIERFAEIRAKHYPGSRLITRVSGVRVHGDQNLDEMKRLWGGLVDQVTFVDYNPWENAYEMPENRVTEPCSDLWRRLFVWWDGRVNPCDVDYKSHLSPGNVRDTSISQLWRGEAYETLRQMHLAGDRQALMPCRGCAVV